MIIDWTAVIAIGMALIALFNLRDTVKRSTVTLMQTQIDRLSTDLEKRNKVIAALRHQARLRDKVLLDRESQVNRLEMKVQLWQHWGDEMGRALNQMQLEIGFLREQEKARGNSAGVRHGTAPLPPLNSVDIRREENDAGI